MSEARYFEGVGRRKRATARVRLYPGEGKVIINEKPLDQFFARDEEQQQVIAPLKVTNNEGRYNLMVLVKGGGYVGQSEAIRHGVARALVVADPGLRRALRDAGYLTRDPREKERKKVGLKRARKAPQYTKR